MNIKIVFNTKTHKISQQHKTLQEIKNAILKLYPQELQSGMNLFFSLTPTQEPIQLFSEEQFNRIKEIYQQFQWQSIKFLVKDIDHPILTNEDLNLLNQSIIIKPEFQQQQVEALRQQLQPQQQPQLQKVVQQSIPQQQEIQDGFEEPIIVQQNIQQTQNNQIQQEQQVKQEQILQQNQFVQEIIKQVDSKYQFDIDFNSQEFKQFVIEQIDERLKFHGILHNSLKQQKQQIQKPIYKMSLLLKQYNGITMYTGQNHQWRIEVKNEGNIDWKIGTVKLIGISGIYQNLQIELSNNTKPQEIGKFVTFLEPPKNAIKDQTQEFKLAYLENNEFVYFGQKICFILNVINNQPQEKKSTITQKDPQFNSKINDQKMRRIQEFRNVTGTSYQDASNFLLAMGDEIELNQAVEMYFESVNQQQ